MITFKPGVQSNLPLLKIIIALERAWASRGQTAIVSSMNDDQHKVGSKHSTDEALDARTWDLPRQPDPCTRGEDICPLLKALMRDLRDSLGPGFDIIFETDIIVEPNKYKRRQHLHVEWDPK